jgi:adenylate cyclase
MRKSVAALTVWIGILLLSWMIYSFAPDLFSAPSRRIDDLFFLHHTPTKPSGRVVIVDIDEASLSAIGQWPWERDTVATLLQKIAAGGAGVIGLDMVFAEADKTSPAYINARAHLHLNHPTDYDAILAQTLRTTPTIGGYVFEMEHPVSTHTPPNVSAIIVERNRPATQTPTRSLYEARGVIPNIPLLQQAFYSSGFFNIIPDPSGIIRRAPLLMRYREQLYPSLALEMLRVALGVQRIAVEYGDQGIDAIRVGDLIIPTDARGSLMLGFRGPARTFKYISAIEVLNGTVPPNAFADTFVLIGSSAAGLLDLRSTPLSSAMAGVEIHATILDNILTGDFLSMPAWIDGLNASIFIGLFSVAFALFLFLGAVWMPIVTIVLGFAANWFVNWMVFDHGWMIHTSLPFLALLLALLAAGLINYFFETRQKKLIRSALARKVSSTVAAELIRHANVTDVLHNREETVTVFFSDIRNFTSLSESIGSPQKLIDLLNRYVDPMTEIILAHRGTVDKFIGDAIMAYWNAPQRVEAHCDRAVQSALEQLDALKKLNADNAQRHLPAIEIGIGINTGKAIVGEVGSRGRSDYTVIGDSVNLAARLEGLTKTYGATLIVSEHTLSCLREAYVVRELDRTRVRGKAEIVRIFEVLALGEPDPNRARELAQHHHALEAWFAGHDQEAYGQFAALYERTSDPLYRLYLKRITREHNVSEHHPLANR